MGVNFVNCENSVGGEGGKKVKQWALWLVKSSETNDGSADSGVCETL